MRHLAGGFQGGPNRGGVLRLPLRVSMTPSMVRPCGRLPKRRSSTSWPSHHFPPEIRGRGAALAGILQHDQAISHPRPILCLDLHVAELDHDAPLWSGQSGST